MRVNRRMVREVSSWRIIEVFLLLWGITIIMALVWFPTADSSAGREGQQVTQSILDCEETFKRKCHLSYEVAPVQVNKE